MPTFPRIDLSDFDVSKIDFSKFELPKFELPQFDVPSFELPKIDLPEVTEQITGFARDAAYVSVGLAVMTAERLQALQAQLVELLKTQLSKVRETV